MSKMVSICVYGEYISEKPKEYRNKLKNTQKYNILITKTRLSAVAVSVMKRYNNTHI